LDHELRDEEAANVTNHLAGCPSCEGRLSKLSALASEARDHLVASDMRSGPTDEDKALRRLQARLEREPADTRIVALMRRRQLSRGRRASLLIASAAALLLVIVIPQTRALASQLLGVFRVQSVVYVQVPQSRVQQLRTLRDQANALFLAKPQPVGAAPTVETVGTLQQASTYVGFALQTPSTLPGGLDSETIQVQGQGVYSMQVNVKTVRQILQTLGVTDVTIPDALGAKPITVTMAPTAEIQYQGGGATLTLIEGLSPSVNLPPGVSLQQLGRAALEVYGMTPDQAAQMSRQIDWNSTLVFPFPEGANNMQQVTVNGEQGILMQSPSDSSNPDSGAQTMIYWQHGARFYILIGQGVGEAATLTTADSVH
jgi:hypothetical protein